MHFGNNHRCGFAVRNGLSGIASCIGFVVHNVIHINLSKERQVVCSTTSPSSSTASVAR